MLFGTYGRGRHASVTGGFAPLLVLWCIYSRQTDQCLHWHSLVLLTSGTNSAQIQLGLDESFVGMGAAAIYIFCMQPAQWVDKCFVLVNHIYHKFTVCSKCWREFTGSNDICVNIQWSAVLSFSLYLIRSCLCKFMFFWLLYSSVLFSRGCIIQVLRGM